MTEYFKQFDIAQLYDLRDYISCDPKYSLSTKQQLMDEITKEMLNRELVQLMKPLAQQFIKQQEK